MEKKTLRICEPSQILHVAVWKDFLVNTSWREENSLLVRIHIRNFAGESVKIFNEYHIFRGLLVIGNELFALHQQSVSAWNLETGKNTVLFEHLGINGVVLWNGHITSGSVDNKVTVWQMKKWSPINHHLFPPLVKDQILTLLKISLISQTSLHPFHPEILFYKLPRDILYQIFEYL